MLKPHSPAYFIYDHDGSPVQEMQGGSITALNTFGPNGLISRNASSDVFYQFDERGDTVERCSTSGSVLDYHGSELFGIQYAGPKSSDPFQGFGAQWGYYCDPATGLSVLGHRYSGARRGSRESWSQSAAKQAIRKRYILVKDTLQSNALSQEAATLCSAAMDDCGLGQPRR